MRLSRELLGTELESRDLHSLGLGWIGVLPSILAIVLTRATIMTIINTAGVQ